MSPKMADGPYWFHPTDLNLWGNKKVFMETIVAEKEGFDPEADRQEAGHQPQHRKEVHRESGISGDGSAQAKP